MWFRYAHEAHPDWSTAALSCAVQLDAKAGDDRYLRGANLGFVYITEPLVPHCDEILATLRARTGVASWVGCSGVGICATGIEYLEEPALAVMLGRFEPGQFNVFSGTQRPPALSVRTDAGAQAAFTALVHGDPRTHDLGELINDMSARVASGYLFGGLASARNGTDMLRMIADRPLQGGLSGAVFSADVGLVSRMTQGVFPLRRAGEGAAEGAGGAVGSTADGPRAQAGAGAGAGAGPTAGAARRARGAGLSHHRVTRAEGRVLITLDDRPAFDVLLEDSGIRRRQDAGASAAAQPSAGSAAAERSQLERLARHGLYVGIEPGGQAEYRERLPGRSYLVRAVTAIDPRARTVAIAEDVQNGAQLSFCARDEESARRDLVRICAEIREHLAETPAEKPAESAAEGGTERRGESSTTEPAPAGDASRSAAGAMPGSGEFVPRQARGAIYVTCVGRGGRLFSGQSEELKIIEQQLGPVPLVGLYAAGEIAGARLHGYTGVLSVFY